MSDLADDRYQSMFIAAVMALAAIDEALGLPDDGCNDPEQTLAAIADLQGENKVLRDLLRTADNVLDTIDPESDAESEGLSALRERIASALA